MRNIREIELSEPLIIAIQQAGSRKLVLVEGGDDQDIFEGYFKQHLSQIYFYDCGGVGFVQKYFEELERETTSKRFFGIRDRDFLDDEKVETSYLTNSRLFVLRWYCIENYLLNEQAVYDELCTKYKQSKRAEIGLNSIEDITNCLGELRQQLLSITAAEWVIAEFNEEMDLRNMDNGEIEGVAYFPNGFAPNRSTIVEKLAPKLNLSIERTVELIEQKENILSNQDVLHTKYNGKRLVHWICKKFKFPDEDYFKRLLISRLNTQNIPDNLKEIVENRILKT